MLGGRRKRCNRCGCHAGVRHRPYSLFFGGPGRPPSRLSPGFFVPLATEGMARREGAACRLSAHLLSKVRRLSARHPDKSVRAYLRRFSLLCRAALRPRSASLGLRLRSHGASRVNRSFAASDFAWRPPSASSWQAPVVGPGGAPAQPECAGNVPPRPRAPRSRRAFARPARDRCLAYLRQSSIPPAPSRSVPRRRPS